MRITLGVVALVALAAVAVASPFAGIEAADEGLGFEIGVSNYGVTVYLLKWVPQTLAGWWAFGGEAAVRIAGLPNISFGAGVLLSIEWDDWEMSDSAWGPYFLVLGSMGSFDVFGKLSYFGDIEEDEPFGAPSLSIGARLYLDSFWAPAKSGP